VAKKTPKKPREKAPSFANKPFRETLKKISPSKGKTAEVRAPAPTPSETKKMDGGDDFFAAMKDVHSSTGKRRS